MRVVADQFGTPTSVATIAATLVQIQLPTANELWAASPADAVANVVDPDPTRLLAFGKEAKLQ